MNETEEIQKLRAEKEVLQQACLGLVVGVARKELDFIEAMLEFAAELKPEQSATIKLLMEIRAERMLKALTPRQQVLA